VALLAELKLAGAGVGAQNVDAKRIAELEVWFYEWFKKMEKLICVEKIERSRRTTNPIVSRGGRAVCRPTRHARSYEGEECHQCMFQRRSKQILKCQ
jgi:hypothetical protein